MYFDTYTRDDSFNLLSTLSSRRLQAPFQLWHACLGNVNFDVISSLQKSGALYVSSLLPDPITCTARQILKSKQLAFYENLKSTLHVLGLIHCDLWGNPLFPLLMVICTLQFVSMITLASLGFSFTGEIRYLCHICSF